MNQQTYATKAKDIKREWHLIDLKDQVLGRVGSEIALLLQGKDKPYYTAHLDCGDYVVVLNAAKVKLTGKKKDQKKYYRHSGYPGGFKEISFKQQLERDPTKIILWAVKNMLPKNKLRDNRLRRLKVFIGSEHKYQDKFKQEKENKS
jgi:large subunit ribosomal protein L13